MLVFIGPSGSGKTTIEAAFQKMGYSSIENYTTRPMREGETEGNPYFFISEEKFLKLKKEGFFAEHIQYNGNHYGFAKQDVTDNKIASVVPDGFRQLSKIKDLNIISFYFEVDEETRYKRMIERGDSPESAKRRIEIDREVFAGIKEECTFIVDASVPLKEMIYDILEKKEFFNNKFYIATRYGSLHPCAPKLDEINILDIAHALSLSTRFNGHCNQLYSVASHSVAIANELKVRGYSPRIQMLGLLHDGSEAYLSDVPKPLKEVMYMYLIVEKNLQDLIYLKYTGKFPTKEELEIVKQVDTEMYYAECERFLPDKTLWVPQKYEENITVRPVADEPTISMKKFLEQFNSIKNEMGISKTSY